MSVIIVNAHQIGIDNVTPSNNFSLQTPTTPNGTLGLYRGNANTPLSTIFTVDTSNNVNFTGLLQGNGAVPTGAFMQFMLTSAPTGWVAGDGSTIGNVGSGATLASTSALALFTAWWTAYTNTQLPILTSAGGASTRGASAAADWAALKRLTVFDVTGRFIRNANGGTVVNGTKYAESIGPHSHPTATNVVSVPGSGSGFGYTYNNVGTGAPVNPGINTGTNNGAGTETIPVNIGMLGCFKL
jgi:hypothetical protein